MEDITQRARIKAANKQTDQLIDRLVKTARRADPDGITASLDDKVMRNYHYVLNEMQERNVDIEQARDAIAATITNMVTAFCTRLFVPQDDVNTVANFANHLFDKIGTMTGEDLLTIYGPAPGQRQ